MTQEITVQTKEVPTFVKKKHELDKILKAVQKVSAEAVKLLEDTMKNEKVDIKLRVDCAKTILEAERATVKQINDEEMARQIAEIKLAGGGTKTLTLDTGSKPKTPALDFETIREV